MDKQIIIFHFFMLSTTECGYNFCHSLNSTQELRNTTSHPVIICRNEVNLDKKTWISKTLTDETSWAADFSFSHYSSIHPRDSGDTKTFSSYSMSLLLGQLDSRHHADRSQRTGSGLKDLGPPERVPHWNRFPESRQHLVPVSYSHSTGLWSNDHMTHVFTTTVLCAFSDRHSQREILKNTNKPYKHWW